jgi:alpha-tubulin suppressor-like RCC1 family protein
VSSRFVSPVRLLTALLTTLLMVLGVSVSASATIAPTSGPATGGTAVTVDGIRFTQISAGSSFTLGLTSEGTVFAWGQNFQGMLGNGTSGNGVYFNTPIQVKGVGGNGFLTGITQVAASGEFSMALSSTGAVYTWGRGAGGQLGNGATVQSNTPVQVVAGAQGSGFLSGVTSIAAGYEHALAVVDGNVFAWGVNGDGQLGDGTTANQSSPVRVLTGAQSDGSGNLSNISQISAGFNFSLSRTSSGSLYSWGNNAIGSLGIGTSGADITTPVQVIAGVQAQAPATFSGATFITAKAGYAMAVTSDGLYAWGSNLFGQIGNGTTDDVNAPSRVLGGAQGGTNLSGITMVTAGSFQAMAVTTSGVFAWGDNSNGQLGDGSTALRTTPVRVLAGASGQGNLASVTAITMGYQSSYALTNSALYAWGNNDSGELGNGTRETSSPIVPNPTPLLSANFQPVSVVFATTPATSLSASGNTWNVVSPAGATGPVTVTATANVFGGSVAATPATVSWNAGTFTYEPALANTSSPDLLPAGVLAGVVLLGGLTLLLGVRRHNVRSGQ